MAPLDRTAALTPVAVLTPLLFADHRWIGIAMPVAAARQASCQPGDSHDPSVVACPFCGGRLLVSSHERPSRLLCVRCGKVQQNSQPTVFGLLGRHALGAMALAVLLVVMPLLVLAMSPWLGQHRERRLESMTRHGSGAEPRRWDPQTGVVGRPSRRD